MNKNSGPTALYDALPHLGEKYSDVQVLKKEICHQGYLAVHRFYVQHRLYQGGWSQTLIRERVERPGAVIVVLYDPAHDTVVMIQQFRVGPLEQETNPWMLEWVAGNIDTAHETPEQVAIRETQEEANCTPKALIKIGECLATPGCSNERFHLFCGRVDSEGITGIHGLVDEGEDILVRVLPMNEVENYLNPTQSAISAPTWLGWLWLKHERAYLQKIWNTP